MLPNQLSDGSKPSSAKVDLHQPESLSRELPLDVDGPLQQQVDGLPPGVGGAAIAIFGLPQLRSLVATNAMLPLLPEHAIVGEVLG